MLHCSKRWARINFCVRLTCILFLFFFGQSLPINSSAAVTWEHDLKDSTWVIWPLWTSTWPELNNFGVDKLYVGVNFLFTQHCRNFYRPIINSDIQFVLWVYHIFNISNMESCLHLFAFFKFSFHLSPILEEVLSVLICGFISLFQFVCTYSKPLGLLYRR